MLRGAREIAVDAALAARRTGVGACGVR